MYIHVSLFFFIGRSRPGLACATPLSRDGGTAPFGSGAVAAAQREHAHAQQLLEARHSLAGLVLHSELCAAGEWTACASLSGADGVSPSGDGVSLTGPGGSDGVSLSPDGVSLSYPGGADGVSPSAPGGAEGVSLSDPGGSDSVSLSGPGGSDGVSLSGRGGSDGVSLSVPGGSVRGVCGVREVCERAWEQIILVAEAAAAVGPLDEASEERLTESLALLVTCWLGLCQTWDTDVSILKDHPLTCPPYTNIHAHTHTHTLTHSHT